MPKYPRQPDGSFNAKDVSFYYWEGRAEERASLAAKIEGARPRKIRTDINDNPTSAEAWVRGKSFGYNQALDDLLTHFRGEEGLLSEPFDFDHFEKRKDKFRAKMKEEWGLQEETECCEQCRCMHNGEDHCKSPNCPCHKPRTEEVTDEELDAALKHVEETEKEGASFSGREKKIVAVHVLPWSDERGNGWVVTKQYADGSTEDVTEEEYISIGPKETTTSNEEDTIVLTPEQIDTIALENYAGPQSREQGGEKKGEICAKSRALGFLFTHGEGCVCTLKD